MHECKLAVYDFLGDGMNIEIIPVGFDDKEILRNLLEKYDYEFSQYDKRDVNQLGLFGYMYLDNYWNEENRWAFFVKVDGKLAGFAMVNDYPETDVKTDYSMAEFFIMHKYRRLGVGKHTAHKLFDMFKGSWQLKCHPGNITSFRFWDFVINEYTKGSYKLKEAYPDTQYADGTLGNVFYFTSKNNKKNDFEGAYDEDNT